MQRSAETLRQIVDREQIFRRGYRRQSRPVRGLAEQVHTDHRPRPEFPLGFYLGDALPRCAGSI